MSGSKSPDLLNYSRKVSFVCCWLWTSQLYLAIFNTLSIIDFILQEASNYRFTMNSKTETFCLTSEFYGYYRKSWAISKIEFTCFYCLLQARSYKFVANTHFNRKRWNRDNNMITIDFYYIKIFTMFSVALKQVLHLYKCYLLILSVLWEESTWIEKPSKLIVEGLPYLHTKV